jgi:peptidoglycan/LPS O-acetylase OafA/YrhL
VKRIPALDTLRAVAILWVIVHHVSDSMHLRGVGLLAGRFLAFGNSGVDLFFVLSGYLIGSLLLAEVQSTGALDNSRFWSRRWLRTLPAYYVTLGLLYSLHLVSSSSGPWPNLPSYLVFVQPYANGPDTLRFAWSWSLCTEEWVYLLLPVAVSLVQGVSRLGAAGALRTVAAAAFLLSVGSRFWIYQQMQAGRVAPDHLTWTIYLVPHYRLDGLAAGLLTATLPKPPRSVWVSTARIAAAALVVALALVPRSGLLELQHFAPLALLYGTLVYTSVGDGWWPRLRIPGARIIADLSYSLYLMHPIAEKVVSSHVATSSLAARLVVFGIVSIALSLALRYGVEVPFLRLRDRSRLAAGVVLS